MKVFQNIQGLVQEGTEGERRSERLPDEKSIAGRQAPQ